MRAVIVGAALLLAATLPAQSPQLVVEAVNTPATTTTKANVAASKTSESLADALKSLEAAKAANSDLMKRQEATLVALDELQKEADQIRIYSKRG